MEGEYLKIAIQYYVAGRSATLASFMPVAGNLFHHAIEMLLKYSLFEHHSAGQLKEKFRHDLKKLWKEFKSKSGGGAALSKYDQIIATLDKMEDLRYPKKGYVFSIDLRKGRHPYATGLATKSLKRYRLNLEEMDELVSALLKRRVTPEWITSLLRYGDGRVQYERENLHKFI